ncbi:unnamed protein product [Absidia cylindrospora]
MVHPTLPLVPLIASTSLTTIGLEALVYVPGLLNLTDGNAISTTFRRYFHLTTGPIVLVGSIASAVGSYLYFRQGGNAYFGWGALFAGIHFAYVPLVMYPVQTVVENNKKDPSASHTAIRKWLRAHKVRLVTDIAATVCFTLALANDK